MENSLNSMRKFKTWQVVAPNTAVKAAPSGRWTLRDKASRSAG